MIYRAFRLKRFFAPHNNNHVSGDNNIQPDDDLSISARHSVALRQLRNLNSELVSYIGLKGTKHCRFRQKNCSMQLRQRVFLDNGAF